MNTHKMLKLLDLRDETDMRLKAIQTELDEAYTAIEKAGYELFQDISGTHIPRRFYWRKVKTMEMSVYYPTEQKAIEALSNNAIEWR